MLRQFYIENILNFIESAKPEHLGAAADGGFADDALHGRAVRIAQRLRDELDQARCAISNNTQSQYILSQLGRYYSNPPCYGQGYYGHGYYGQNCCGQSCCNG